MAFTELNKRSKKAQKEYNSKQRGSWGTVNPCTRTEPDKTKFRKAARSREKAALAKGCF